MRAYLIVLVGGGIGSALRHAVNVAFARWFGTSFPFHTLFENVSGSLLMGLIAGYFAFKGDASQAVRLFLTTGVLGGYTTFSAFSLEAMLLWEQHHIGKAALYVLLSVVRSPACGSGSISRARCCDGASASETLPCMARLPSRC
jgi:CrcB protein